MEQFAAEIEAELESPDNVRDVIFCVQNEYPGLLDATTANECIGQMSYEDFKLFLLRTNGLLRGVNIDDFDGHNMVLEGSFFSSPTPDDEDKDMLLGEIFGQAKTLPSAADRGLLIALGINLVHPFADGNGRVSRMSYLLFSGQATTERLGQVLMHEGRKVVDISPSYLTKLVHDDREEDIAFAYFNKPELKSWKDIYTTPLGEDVPQEMREQIIIMLQTSHENLARYALLEHVANRMARDTSAETYLENVVVTNRYHVYDTQTDSYYSVPITVTQLAVGDLFFDMPQAEVQEILDLYRAEKNAFVRTMIDALVNPSDHPHADKSGYGSYSNLKEYLLYNLRSKLNKLAEVIPEAP